MLPEFHTARGYQAFDNLIRRVELWASNAIPSVGEYHAKDIAVRTVQRVAEVALNPYVKLCASRAENGFTPIPSEKENFECGGLVLNYHTGKVRPTFLAIAAALANFWMHWGHVLGVFTLAAIHRQNKRQEGSATLLVGVDNIIGKDGDSRFVDYCKHGPIAPFSSAKRVIIQSATAIESSDSNSFSYARFPLFQLVQFNTPNWLEYLRFLASHFISAKAYFWGVVRSPVICLLGRDFAYHAMAESLNRRELIESLVTTNSNYLAQPLWMTDLPARTFQTHMVWYAQNTVPIVYAADPIRVNIPNYRHMRIDVSWVWTEGYSEYLKSLAISGDIHVVGPILWYLPLVVIPEKSSDEIVIVAFDVTPVNNGIAEKLAFFGNYYSADNMLAFLRGVVTLSEALNAKLGKRVKLLLKHKRAHNPIHDSEYIALVEQLCEQGIIELVSFETNMYSLLAMTDLVVVIPYSSPALIASSMGVAAVFFDPTSEVLPFYEKTEGIYFSSGEENLIQTALELISEGVVCKQ